MKAISDYMALYEIWKAMDGPNWSYAGETYVAKSNWKFDGRPIDEWGNQPGVQVNADGRVKSLDLGSFNAKGDIPEALGKLTELESLWLGKHDDDLYETESVSYKLSKYSLYHKGVDLRKNRLSIAREELALRHPRRKASPMCNQKKSGLYLCRACYIRCEQGRYIQRNYKHSYHYQKLAKVGNSVYRQCRYQSS